MYKAQYCNISLMNHTDRNSKELSEGSYHGWWLSYGEKKKIKKKLASKENDATNDEFYIEVENTKCRKGSKEMWRNGGHRQCCRGQRMFTHQVLHCKKEAYVRKGDVKDCFGFNIPATEKQSPLQTSQLGLYDLNRTS